MSDKTTFAVLFGNRGFFPASLQKAARSEMRRVLEGLGHAVLMIDESATRHGAVESPREGRLFADFLRANRGRFGGVILCLPNFGDETGAIAALKDAGVPILVHAYPDELDKMAPELRRDAFCGKLSAMDVFCQYGLKFTALKPHTVSPSAEAFAGNIDYFDRLCRVVGGMKDMTVGAIGARTTPFKTVRIDELTLQRYGITTETVDLSAVFGRMDAISEKEPQVKAKAEVLADLANWDDAPTEAFDKLVRLGVVLDRLIEEMELDALAVRCWLEMQQQLGISPCVLLGELNGRPIAVACEVDVGNAVMMHALRLASGGVAACLDWNNNYGDDPDKCILFHCGPVPRQMMAGPGRIADHSILSAAVGKNRGWGCNIGRIAPTPFTFASMLTAEGRCKCYIGQGRFTDDPIPDDYFGCAGVAEIEGLQDALQTIGYAGHRHHVSVTPAHVLAPAAEALTKYLGYELTIV